MNVYRRLLIILKHRGEDLLLFSIIIRGVNVIIGAIVAFVISTVIQLKTGELALNAEFLTWIDFTYIIILICSGLILLFFSVIEIVGMIYISHSYERVERPTILQTFKYSYFKSLTLGNTYGLTVCIAIFFAFILFPIINIGPSVFSQFSIPSFVTSELVTNRISLFIGVGAMLLLFYLLYRFIFSFHVFTTRSISFIGACKASWMITSRRKNFRELFTFTVMVPAVFSLMLICGTAILLFGVAGLLNALILLFTNILPNSFAVLFYSIWVFSSAALISLVLAPFIISAMSAYLEVRHPSILGIESARHVSYHDLPFLRNIFLGWLLSSKKHIFVFGTLSFICFGLFSNAYLRIFEITNSAPLLISHRGFINGSFGVVDTENTFDSFISSLNIGINGIETDLQMLDDGTVVFFHDEKIKTSNGDILVTDLTYSQLSSMGVTVTSLAELVKSDLFNCNTRWFMEIKDYSKNGSSIEILMALEDIIKEKEMYDCVYVGSFDLQSIYDFKKNAPKIKTNLYVYNIVRDKIDSIDISRIDSLSIEKTLISSKLARLFLDNRKEVYVWTVNDVSSINKLTLLGVTGIITDYPLQFKSYIEKKLNTPISDKIQVVEIFGKVYILDFAEIWNFKFNSSL